jgi:hypothetical protein
MTNDNNNCKFCANFDFATIRTEIEVYAGKTYARIAQAGGSMRFPTHQQFNYCPECGVRQLKRGDSSQRLCLVG